MSKAAVRLETIVASTNDFFILLGAFGDQLVAGLHVVLPVREADLHQLRSAASRIFGERPPDDVALVHAFRVDLFHDGTILAVASAVFLKIKV